MAHFPVPRPEGEQPLTDNGFVTRPWHRFFIQLWERTGGGDDLVGGGLQASNNLSDVDSAGTSRTNLGFADPILDKDAPGTIGADTPGSGAFTTLTASNNAKFQAREAADVLNVTGNATVYTVVWDTEVFDVGGNFSSTAFTAPATGQYALEASLLLSGVTAAGTTGLLKIVTSNREYEYRFNPATMRNAAGQISASLSVFADMEISDTATVTIQISGEAGDIVDILGDATNSFSFFSGRFIP